MADEILAHISAPVTRHNDDLYRSVADAYLAFEPYQSTDRSATLANPTSLAPPSQITPKASNRGVLADIPGNNSILSTSKESYGSFPSHLSSGDFMRSSENVPAFSQGSPTPKESMIVSSRLTRLEHIHQAWKSSKTVKSSFDKPEDDKDPPSTNSNDLDTAFIEDTQLAAQVIQSQLEDGFFTTFEDLSDEGTEVHESPAKSRSPASSCHNERDEALNFLHVPHASSHTGMIPIVANTTSLQSAADTSELAASSIPYSEHTKDTSKSFSSTAGVPEVVNLSNVPLHAFPPAPRISVEQPAGLPTQVTSHLATLKTQNLSRFSPRKRARILRSDERGYWLVDCSHWPARTQREFWDALCEHITSGRVGWGTTLHRDPLPDTSLGLIRLYCWGEVVEHMWLLLWVCSQGNLIGSKTRWIDADGVAVLQVP